MRIPNVVWIPAAVAILVVSGACPAARAEEGRAIAAMQVAFQRECSTRQMYLAYARRADDECCEEVAVLFRALAEAESVHARNHAFALEQLDVTPRTVAEPVTVGTTAENLRAAIDAEIYERRVAYPQFMGYASDECLYDVLASFRYAHDAETTHAIRLTLALARLEHGGQEVGGAAADATPVQGAVTYYVCMGCGCVRCTAPAGHCVCGTSATQCATFVTSGLPPMPALLSLCD